MNKRVFALDIGTRSVTGIILEKNQQTYTIVDYCVKEHNERSMLDGQIHNVLAVADIITHVKATLEEKHGPLTHVSVAAAGRSLKTVQATASINLDQQPISNNQTIKHLELSAVQSAQFELARDNEDNTYKNYYCVGYSVLHYKLDGENIGSLIDQSGHEASVDIIATFLPKVVVESLLAALNRAELNMDALTLEPIAAIHVLIPKSMRRLNVALVDIGAGTSDIALTKDGTIVAYGMVPVAGDKITEALSDQYLLDFPKAEETKRHIVNQGEAVVADILGFEHMITYEQLVEDINSHIDELAYALAEEILNLNQRPPQAVMLIGGGSQTPEIATSLAKKLQLPDNRVAVRGIDAIENLKTSHLPAGPDFVTPIGIAITANQSPVHYITVTVNDTKIRMFEMKQLTIGDCLIQAGIDINKQYGKPGLAAFITVNGKSITIPGELGQPPTLLLNGEHADVDAYIKNGDYITLQKGEDGKHPSITLQQLLGDIPPATVIFNGREYQLKPTYDVNDEQQTEEYIIKDKDTIKYKQSYTINDFLAHLSMSLDDFSRPFNIIVNDQQININKGARQLLLNGQRVHKTSQLNNNDRLDIIEAEPPTVKDLLDLRHESYWRSIQIMFNGKQVTLKHEQLSIMRDDEKLHENSKLYNDDHITIKEKQIHSFIFQDVFRFVDIDLSKAKGSYTLYKNNELATFHEPINDGDHLVLEWANYESKSQAPFQRRTN